MRLREASLRLIRTAALMAIITSGRVAAGDELPTGLWEALPDKGHVSYRITHRFHEIEGKSTAVQARALVSRDEIKVQVRIPVTSFNSGNKNRDANAMAAVEAAKYPFVEFKGTGRPCAMVAGTCKFPLQGTLAFHGVTQPVQTEVEINLIRPNAALARFGFLVRLEDYHVERPSLLFIKIENAMPIQGEILMERKP